MLLVAGVSSSLAGAAALALAAAILVAGLARLAARPTVSARRSGWSIIAALTATPIVWDHYMVLLFVPIALASPRLSEAWLLPLCTPLMTLVSEAIIPVSHRLAAHPPETLRSALPWLLIEAAVAVRLVMPGLHLPRSARARRHRPRLRSAPAAGSAELA